MQETIRPQEPEQPELTLEMLQQLVLIQQATIEALEKKLEELKPATLEPLREAQIFDIPLFNKLRYSHVESNNLQDQLQTRIRDVLLQWMFDVKMDPRDLQRFLGKIDTTIHDNFGLVQKRQGWAENLSDEIRSRLHKAVMTGVIQGTNLSYSSLFLGEIARYLPEEVLNELNDTLEKYNNLYQSTI